jgi:hypothetical protein
MNGIFDEQYFSKYWCFTPKYGGFVVSPNARHNKLINVIDISST